MIVQVIFLKIIHKDSIEGLYFTSALGLPQAQSHFHVHMAKSEVCTQKFPKNGSLQSFIQKNLCIYYRLSLQEHTL